MSFADKVIEELGITEPDEIDLEAIACHLGAKIKYEDMDSCEACIVGGNDRAIIRVSTKVRPERQRFSIGHELGHWCHHRNQPLFCKPEEVGANGAKVRDPKEKTADGYASDLLMPRRVFNPVARQYKTLNFDTVRQIARVFKTSVTSTAIRLVEGDHSPSMIVCHGQKGRKWFSRSKSVPERWFPQNDLDRQSGAFDIQFGQGTEQRHPQRIGADAWFDRHDASRYDVHEQTIRTMPGETLTFLLFRDQKMLSEEDDRRSFRR
ncbi:ImmA/IrrE family metallo-endopeptidase [Rhizobium leguminosarum]|uniref:ImmA/IrrE family metallo-endopeptidase n=1 Tax=Rhizobium leguminosarum TaxID=384 RepID=A0A7M3DWJ9_RHILE|nr:ImmA/IrrE family metallo-endopeptidase [Rhizobium leguminosarum]TAY52950.1 ImmA/IrrE family metallo-endopeptidase [Rhizobium leguminosarum]